MVQCYIPAGTFQMGSDSGDSDEQPVHSVALDAFWMDQTEVTNAQYALCVEAGACYPPDHTGSYSRSSYFYDAAYANYPVIYINDWSQAVAYCTWAGRELPTEAQWEYAARGGLAGALYPWGYESPVCTLGAENGAQFSSCMPYDTILIGSFSPNGFGLFDMAGNVWEWVADWYDDTYYSISPAENPTGPASGDYHVLRGSSWYYHRYFLRVSDRYDGGPAASVYGIGSIGFRCAHSP